MLHETRFHHSILRPRPLLLLLGMLVMSGGGIASADAATCRVSTSGSAASDGSSWLAAKSLQGALADTTCTELWLKAGVYLPVVPADPGHVTDTERDISFDIRPGLAVYGGFAGTEVTRAQRDPDLHRTILSGDIDGNDSVDADGVTADADDIVGDNSYHVVMMDGTTGTPIGPDTVLDGLTITAGSAQTSQQWGGGGLFCDGSGAGSKCSPSLGNLRFVGNQAYYGGAMYFSGGDGEASPTLLRVVVRGNAASDAGGGLVADVASGTDPGQSRVTIVAARFIDNRTRFDVGGPAEYQRNGGGAIATLASGTGLPDLHLSITDSSFVNNTSPAQGGALLFACPTFGGSPMSTLTLSDVTFASNHAEYNGGAIAVAGKASPLAATLRNVTFADNTADNGGGLMIDGMGSSDPQLTLDMHNTILWGNIATNSGSQMANRGFTATIEHSLIQGGCPGGATCSVIVTSDPLLGSLADNGGFTRTLLPAPGSAAIDAGNDASCTAQDQRGIQRPQGWHCDIGAVEVGGQPVLSVSDGNDYARYGQTLQYVVTLHNPGSASFNGITVAGNVPAQLDAAAMHWTCLSAAALCTDSGNGPLGDAAVNLPPFGSISWMVSAPVRTDASESGGIRYQVTADSTNGLGQQASDTDTLGLFRDGFDVSGANGTNALDANVPRY